MATGSVRHTEDMGDPTGLSSTVGQVVILAGLIGALVVLLWRWRNRR